MYFEQLRLGRTFGITLEKGDDFFRSLRGFCENTRLSQGYIRGLVNFSYAEVVGTTAFIEDNRQPLGQGLSLHNVDGLCLGGIYRDTDGEMHMHVHVGLSRREHDAVGRVAHLRSGMTGFVCELVVDEIIEPRLILEKSLDVMNLSILRYAPSSCPQ